MIISSTNKQLAAGVAILIASLVVLYWPAFVGLHSRWVNPDEPYTHGYLVLAMAMYMVFSRALQFTGGKIAPRWEGLGLVVIFSVLWEASHLVQTQALMQLLLPLILWGWLYTVFGWHFVRKLTLPLLFLYFIIPVWGVFGIPLRSMAVVVVSHGLQVLNIPFLVDGFNIHLPSGTIAVAGGCSGQNYLLTGLVVGSFYALNFLVGRARLSCMLLILALSLLANWVRIFILVLVGHYSQMTHPLVREHVTFGWLVFAVFLVVFFVGMRLLENRTARGAEGLSDRSPDLSNVNAASNGPPVSRPALLFSVAVVVLAAGLPIAGVELVQGRNVSEPQGIALSGYVVPIDTPSGVWLPSYLGYDKVQVWEARHNGSRISISALSYFDQQQGKELIHGSNHLLGASRGKVLSPVVLSSGVTLGRAIVNHQGLEHYIYWVYKVANHYTISPITAKLWQIKAILIGRPEAAIISFVIPCTLACSQEGPTNIDGLMGFLPQEF